METEMSRLTVPEPSMIETNGVTLHVMQAGDPNGEPVLLLHGFPEFWYGWKAQIPALAAAGYRVMAPDQRGYNLSDKPEGVAAYRMANLTGDMLGLLDALGHEQVRLVGHDWGAMVAWYLAMNRPERFSQLVILNVPHPQVFSDYIRSHIGQLFKSWYAGAFQIPALPEYMLQATDYMQFEQILKTDATMTADDLPLYQEAWRQPGAMTSMINWYRAIVRFPPKRGDGRVKVPTLVMWGMKDFALSYEMAELSTAMADEGRLVLFREIGHFVQHAHAARVNELMLAFFEHGLSLGEGVDVAVLPE